MTRLVRLIDFQHFVPYPRTSSSRRAYLFALCDDYSRLLVHGFWVAEQNTRAGQDVLRAAIQRRGVPERLYVDTGAPYANAVLERSCAVLGIRLIHSRPYAPEGRGKLERLNRFIRERFLTEAEAHGIASFAELNDRFLAWAEQVCNTRQHAETSQTPIERFLSQGPLQTVEPALLREAFRWSVLRRVTTTASVSLAGNRYSVDPSLIGRRVVVIIDEAHLLAPDQLEELRLLTNAEMDSQSPFALLLVGQPTLARQLRLGVFAALDQRIATRYQLAPMDLAEAAQYLRHHLALVGRTDPLFADDAVARLHKLSLGLPRALNNAAIAALIAAATAGKVLVDDDCAKKAVAELTRE